MKTNNYEIEKNIEKLKRNQSTGFLTPVLIHQITSKLKKEEYQIYSPYQDADKKILYTNILPKIKLFKIHTTEIIAHPQILGSLFSLNITSEVFGDIIKYQDNFYVYLLDTISHLITTELTTIGHAKVKLEEIPLDTLKDYQRSYQKKEYIVSSLRIDTVAAKLIGCNRENVKTKISSKEIILNYEILKKNNYLLKEGDIFSIKGIGKFKYIQVIGTTKKDNYIIELDQYI